MELNFPTLTADQIEVKIKQCGEKGAVALLYKTARTDMDMLDKVVGPMNWQRTQEEIKGNLYCTISIWDAEKQRWVSKSDCGIESRSDGDGNEKKGEASDAFKRAGFCWGIGRELYTSPFTFLKVPTVKDDRTGKFKLQNPFSRFEVSDIGYNGNRAINRLIIIDDNGNTVYSFGTGRQQTKAPEQKAEKPAAIVTKSQKISQYSARDDIKAFCTENNMQAAQFEAYRKALVAGGLVDDLRYDSMAKADVEALCIAMKANYLQEAS